MTILGSIARFARTPARGSSIARSVVAVLLVCAPLLGQIRSITDGFTPPAAAPGSPAGSYALSGFDTVNLFSGSLNFRLPLLQIGGRGEASYTMMLAIEPAHWRVEAALDPATGPDSVVPGWWNGGQGSYIPGYLIGRYVAEIDACTGNVSGSTVGSSLSRLTFTAADGTEYELIDSQHYGAPIQNLALNTCQPSSAPRGTRFISTNGSGLTFISNSAIDDTQVADPSGSGTFTVSGNLYFRDGSMYQIVSSFVKSIRDRNGNRTTLTYENERTLTPNQSFQNDPSTHRLLTITDPLGRNVSITYGAGSSPSDDISYTGSDGPRHITVHHLPLGSVSEINQDLGTTQTVSTLRSDFIRTDGTGRMSVSQLFANSGLNLNDQTPVSYSVVSSVTLPNGKSYTFQYNPYAEIARATLPTGGAYEYDFGFGGNGSSVIGARPEFVVYRRLSQRRVFRENGVREQTVVYSLGPGSSNTTLALAKHYDGSLDPATLSQQTPLLTEKHYFNGDPLTEVAAVVPLGYSPALDGRETQSQEMVQDGQVPLRTILSKWDQQWPVPFSAASYIANVPPPYNPRITQTITTTDGVTSSQVFCYDNTNAFNNRTDVFEYDFGFSGAPTTYCASTPPNNQPVNPPGGFLRHTQTTFNTSAAYTADAVHLLSLPLEQQIFDGSGLVADTKYCYDGAVNGCIDNSSLSDTGYGDITGHEFTFSGLFGASYTTRGNATTISRWAHGANIADTWIYNRGTYDIAGNVTNTYDGNGNHTGYSYADSFLSNGPPAGETHAFATLVTNALGQITTIKYDYNIGKPRQVTDPNSTSVNFTYTGDLLDRLKFTQYPIGSATYTYDDTPGAVMVTTTRPFNSPCPTSAPSVVSRILYDGLGREKRSETGGIPVDRTYDPLGRLFQVSNPGGGFFTTFLYDVLNRPVLVTAPDSSPTVTGYSGGAGTVATVRDPQDKWRQTVTDALGRLTQVIEDPTVTTALANCPAGITCTHSSSLSPLTTYGYDALDDLKTVTQSAPGQGAVSRTFSYDSLKRLATAINPESRQTAYTYDNNGNVLTRTDARNVVTTYGYDGLNRLRVKTYIGSGAAVTPSVSYVYDLDMREQGDFSQNFPIGRLSQVGTSASAMTYNRYDALGRVTASRQDTAGTPYRFSYTYNDQSLDSETYPSLTRKIEMCYDPVGRVQEVKNLSGPSLPSYASGVQYKPYGAIQQLTLGNLVVEATGFDDTRMQPTTVAASHAGSTLLSLGLSYCAGAYPCSTNNGNVLAQSIYFPTRTVGQTQIPGLSVTQNYGYDPLNRLASFQETGGQPNQTNNYDAFGNRWVTGWIPYAGQTPASDVFPNNRWADGSGVSYDPAGNQLAVLLTGNNGTRSFTYDAESRVQTAAIPGMPPVTYVYDGDGRRVQKMVGSTTTTYVYDAMGQLAAEYGGPAPSVTGTMYLTADHLGSTRLVTDSGGNPLRRTITRRSERS